MNSKMSVLVNALFLTCFVEENVF
uniref:Uncharacterized protein n=1 Tax=Anguilla anguilla TaxID=7936 RepID=A0A0E9R5D2_ANGAN